MSRRQGGAIAGDDLGDCPFCDKRIAVALDNNGDPNGLVHPLPMCAEFRTMGVLEFAVAMRVKASGASSSS